MRAILRDGGGDMDAIICDDDGNIDAILRDGDALHSPRKIGSDMGSISFRIMNWAVKVEVKEQEQDATRSKKS
jgi:hypothetical protein